jgi:hypothetical protein
VLSYLTQAIVLNETKQNVTGTAAMKQLGLLQWKQAQNKENKFGFHGSILAWIELLEGFVALC